LGPPPVNSGVDGVEVVLKPGEEMLADELVPSGGRSVEGQRHLLDTQARDRPGDHQLLDLAGAFEDRVDHPGPSRTCRVVWLRPLTRHFACGQSVTSVRVRQVVGMSRDATSTRRFEGFTAGAIAVSLRAG
jgi:hypothetical protein